MANKHTAVQKQLTQCENEWSKCANSFNGTSELCVLKLDLFTESWRSHLTQFMHSSWQLSTSAVINSCWNLGRTQLMSPGLPPVPPNGTRDTRKSPFAVSRPLAVFHLSVKVRTFISHPAVVNHEGCEGTCFWNTTWTFITALQIFFLHIQTCRVRFDVWSRSFMVV